MASGLDNIRWVERHEALQDANHVRFVDEDFRGISLDTTHGWNVTNTGGRGTNNLKDGDPNGVLAMVTGNQINDELAIDRNNLRTVRATLSPAILVRAKALSVAAVEVRIGLEDVLGTDHCIFLVDVSATGTDIYANAYKAGAQTQNTDTAINLDTSYHYYAIYVNSDGKPYWYIDGALKVTGDNADVDLAEYFQPYVQVKTEAAATKTLEVDFIKGWQKRE